MKIFYIIFALMSSTFVSSANASLVKEAWGVLTDPFKLDAGTQNVLHAIERAAIHANRITNDIDASIEQRLDQLSTVISDARKEYELGLDHTASTIADLQTKIFADTADLIKCTTEVTLTQVQNKLSESLNDLGARKPRISLFGWVILEAEIDPSDIKSPIEAFRNVKALYDAKLASLTGSEHPREITDIYGEMSRVADLTRCHYKNETNVSIELYQLELEYIRLGKYWVDRVKI